MGFAELRSGRKPELRDAFCRGRPFPHIVVDDFLDPGLAQELFQTFPRFEEERAIAEHGRVGGKATREDLPALGAPFQKLDRFFRSKDFLSWVEGVTGIPDLIFDPEYVGGGTHENLNGQDMSVHIDFNFHPKQGWHRRVNALLYLNPEWQEEWGGALELWKDPWQPLEKNEVVKIVPRWNRLVVFPTTESSWHGFEAVSIPHSRLSAVPSRRSIAIYLYTKERPPHEVGLPHSTVYYERPMPDTLRAGSVLSKRDFDEVMRLTARRDGLLQTLYEREKKLGQVIYGYEKRSLESQLAMNRMNGWNLSLSTEVAELKDWNAKLTENAQQLSQWKDIQDEWNTRKREYRSKLVRDGKEGYSGPVVALLSNKQYLLVHGLWPGLDLGYPTRFEVDLMKEPNVGDWVLLRVPHTECFTPVQIASLENAVCQGRQPVRPRDVFFARGQIQGVILAVFKEDGRRVELPPQGSLSWKGWLAGNLFLFIHEAKNLLLARVKSRWLWELSKAYRKLFSIFGAEVPVIPPKADS